MVLSAMRDMHKDDLFATDREDYNTHLSADWIDGDTNAQWCLFAVKLLCHVQRCSSRDEGQVRRRRLRIAHMLVCSHATSRRMSRNYGLSQYVVRIAWKHNM